MWLALRGVAPTVSGAPGGCAGSRIRVGETQPGPAKRRTNRPERDQAWREEHA